MDFIFVSVPYTGTPDEKQERYNAVARYIATLMNEGKHAYSPVALGHPIIQITDLSGDFKFWKEHCFGFIDMCSEVHVLTINGTELSAGVMAEIEYAVAINKKIVYVTPNIENDS